MAALTAVVLNFIGLDPKWYVPGIFLALYAILRAVTEMRARNPGVESITYRTLSDFYADIYKWFKAAESQMWVTYTRPVAPESPSEMDRYVRSTVEWAKNHPEREFRRMITVPASGCLTAWLLQLHEEAKTIGNYRVRVVPGSGPGDDFNLAIIDHRTALLAISADGTNITLCTIDAPEAVRICRESYIRRWEQAEPLSEYLRTLNAQV